MSKYKLTKKIINLSNSKNWYLAKLEWGLDIVYILDDPDSCLCGQYPIKEVCIIKNKNNGKTTLVGNCCVKKFLELDTNKIFQSIKKVKKDIEKSFNPSTIEYAHKKKLINEWEKLFYINIWRKQNLTNKQLNIKVKINNTIIKNLKK